jgi:hypothetical protein
LCQHPSLFEEFFQVIEEAEITVATVNESQMSDDAKDAHSLFATAVKIRRKNNHHNKPRLTSHLTLRFIFDDENEMKRISERYFIIEDESTHILIS